MHLHKRLTAQNTLSPRTNTPYHFLHDERQAGLVRRRLLPFLLLRQGHPSTSLLV